MLLWYLVPFNVHWCPLLPKMKIFLSNMVPFKVFPACLFNTFVIVCCNFTIPCWHSYFFYCSCVILHHPWCFLGVLNYHWPSLGHPWTTMAHWFEFLLRTFRFKMFGRYVPFWDVLSKPWLNKPTFEQSQWFKGFKTLDLLGLFGLKIKFKFF